MPVVEDFQEMAPLLGRERRQAPVIQVRPESLRIMLLPTRSEKGGGSRPLALD